MITKMKKLTFLVYHKEYEAFLTRIQELGVLHVQATQEGSAEPTSELEEKLRQAARVKSWMARLKLLGAEGGEAQASGLRTEDVLERLDATDEARRKAEAEIQRLRKDEAAVLPWGNFDPQRVAGLSAVGYVMDFFTCPERMFSEEWADEYNAIEIAHEKGKVYFVTITPKGQEVAPEAERLRLPQVTLADVQRDIRQKEEIVAALDGHLARMAPELSLIHI